MLNGLLLRDRTGVNEISSSGILGMKVHMMLGNRSFRVIYISARKLHPTSGGCRRSTDLNVSLSFRIYHLDREFCCGISTSFSEPELT